MTLLQDFVTQFVKKLDLGSLEPEANGIYQIPLENGTMITLSETEGGGYRLHTIFASVPDQKKEAFFAHCLCGNLFGAGTAGAVLGLDEAGRRLTLTRTAKQENFQKFYESIEDFLNAIRFWSKEATK